jgi:hypothetical protein
MKRVKTRIVRCVVPAVIVLAAAIPSAATAKPLPGGTVHSHSQNHGKTASPEDTAVSSGDTTFTAIGRRFV